MGGSVPSCANRCGRRGLARGGGLSSAVFESGCKVKARSRERVPCTVCDCAAPRLALGVWCAWGNACQNCLISSERHVTLAASAPTPRVSPRPPRSIISLRIPQSPITRPALKMTTSSPKHQHHSARQPPLSASRACTPRQGLPRPRLQPVSRFHLCRSCTQRSRVGGARAA